MGQLYGAPAGKKKEPYQTILRLTKRNHEDLFRIFIARAEYFILALLAHPGYQELFLGKLAVKSFDFTAAGVSGTGNL
jgi:hypothetical protein